MIYPPPLARAGNFGRNPLRGKWLIALLLLCSPVPVSGQTWAGNRLRPSASEIAVIDRTGEARWLWGAEDVAGDGLNQFTAAEQAIDARSVYLRADGTRLWWRTYVSSAVAPANNLAVYLFVDADLNANSGLSAAAPEIDPAFTEDISLGGYEYVVGVRGDGTRPVLWELNTQRLAFAEVTASRNQLDAEANVALDPLRVGAGEHGYVQVSIAGALLSMTGQCQARFYVRATNQTQALGLGDLEIGEAIACVAVDLNQNRVPDVLEPVAACSTDDQCPNGGRCWNGDCWLAPLCIDDTTCPANYTCSNGGCVAVIGTNCRVESDCVTGICANGLCVACTTDPACGTGRLCSPDGRCVVEDVAGPSAGGSGNSAASVAGTTGIYLLDGERIQGGPCACRYVSPRERSQTFGWIGVLTGLLLWRSRRHGQRGQSR